MPLIGYKGISQSKLTEEKSKIPSAKFIYDIRAIIQFEILFSRESVNCIDHDKLVFDFNYLRRDFCFVDSFVKQIIVDNGKFYNLIQMALFAMARLLVIHVAYLIR